MTQSELLRLERVEVDGLFNVYNHYIDLNLDDRVTILHGPKRRRQDGCLADG